MKTDRDMSARRSIAARNAATIMSASADVAYAAPERQLLVLCKVG